MKFRWMLTFWDQGDSFNWLDPMENYSLNIIKLVCVLYLKIKYANSLFEVSWKRVMIIAVLIRLNNSDREAPLTKESQHEL